MSEKRIIAIFVPEAWINDYPVEIDGRVEFDVTEKILAMTEEERAELRDDQYESDDLVPARGDSRSALGPLPRRGGTGNRGLLRRMPGATTMSAKTALKGLGATVPEQNALGRTAAEFLQELFEFEL
jgi:hypothetical protein